MNNKDNLIDWDKIDVSSNANYKDKFWTVDNNGGLNVSRNHHVNLSAAQEEAQQMSIKYPGIKFYILEVVGFTEGTVNSRFIKIN